MSRPIDHTGKRYGRLTAIRRDFDNLKNGTYWICRCKCGKEKSVPSQNLVRGMAKSCGCLQREAAAKAQTKHGCSAASTAEYKSWMSMRTRCENASSINYKDYGGRGISICERWKSFENFIADMGKKPGPKYEIDRKDNEGDYCPENCRWATRRENSRNKRNNRLVEFDGDVQPLIVWCEKFKIPYHRALGRLNRGWTPEEAFAN